MTGQLTNLEDEPDRELAQVPDRPSRRFPHLSERWLQELARTVPERFREAPVRTFVPLLVEHQVVGSVRRTSAALSTAEGSLPPPTPFRRHGREAGRGRGEVSPEASPEPGSLQGRAGQQAQRPAGLALRTSWWHSLLEGDAPRTTAAVGAHRGRGLAGSAAAQGALSTAAENPDQG